MNPPETKLETAELLAEAESDIARQHGLVADLHRDGHTTEGSEILLEMLKEARAKCRAALVWLRKAQP